MITQVFTEEMGQQRFLIGSIDIDPLVHPDENQAINDYWDKWHEEVEEPEADSEFITWLESLAGFTAVTTPITYVVVTT